MKKQKYNVGDIFRIPLGENLTGFGRVLRKLGDTILIEAFDIESFHEKELKTIYTKCCWDDDLKNGKWKVIEHLEIPIDYKIPDFWGTRAYDGSYFKVIGETLLTGENGDDEKRVNITKDEIEGLEKYGVAVPEGIVIGYLERLNGGNK